MSSAFYIHSNISVTLCAYSFVLIVTPTLFRPRLLIPLRNLMFILLTIISFFIFCYLKLFFTNFNLFDHLNFCDLNIVCLLFLYFQYPVIQYVCFQYIVYALILIIVIQRKKNLLIIAVNVLPSYNLFRY